MAIATTPSWCAKKNGKNLTPEFYNILEELEINYSKFHSEISKQDR